MNLSKPLSGRRKGGRKGGISEGRENLSDRILEVSLLEKCFWWLCLHCVFRLFFFFLLLSVVGSSLGRASCLSIGAWNRGESEATLTDRKRGSSFCQLSASVVLQ